MTKVANRWVDMAKTSGRLIKRHYTSSRYGRGKGILAPRQHIAIARSGRWSEADGEAVPFSQDQVGRGQLFGKEEGQGKHRGAATGSR